MKIFGKEHKTEIKKGIKDVMSAFFLWGPLLFFVFVFMFFGYMSYIESLYE